MNGVPFAAAAILLSSAQVQAAARPDLILDCKVKNVMHFACGGGLRPSGAPPVDCNKWTPTQIEQVVDLHVKLVREMAVVCSNPDSCSHQVVYEVSQIHPEGFRVSYGLTTLTGEFPSIKLSERAEAFQDGGGFGDGSGNCVVTSGRQSFRQFLRTIQ